MLHPKKLSGYFLSFIAWSAVFAVLYHLGADVYANVLVVTAETLTNLVLPVTIHPNPNGFVVFSSEASAPMGVPYRLYLIGLNVIFAPALVLTTLGANESGAVRALLAVLIVLLLQAIEVVSIVLFSASHPDNTLFSLGFSATTVQSIAWVYKFLDRMAYALFPFIAWAIVASDLLRRGSSGPGSTEDDIQTPSTNTHR